MSANVMRWRVSDSAPIPVLVECEGAGEWPDLDADGNVIYENTHFADERDAWAQGLKSVEAGVALAVIAVDAGERLFEEACERERAARATKDAFAKAFEISFGARCTCDTNPDTTDGPNIDCPAHGIGANL